MRNLALISVIAAVAVGCGPRAKQDNYVPEPVAPVPVAKVDTATGESLMPLREGNQWTYAVTVGGMRNGQRIQDNEIEMTWKVVKVTPVENGQKATIEISSQGKVNETQTWLVNDEGIFQVTAGKTPVAFSTPQPVAMFPAEEGKEFEWSGTGVVPISPKPGKITSESKTRGPQEVDTDDPVGRYSAVPVETSTVFEADGRKADSQSTVWLSPDVGIVRYRQETVMQTPQGANGVVTVMRLKGKSLVGS